MVLTWSNINPELLVNLVANNLSMWQRHIFRILAIYILRAFQVSQNIITKANTFYGNFFHSMLKQESSQDIRKFFLFYAWLTFILKYKKKIFFQKNIRNYFKVISFLLFRAWGWRVCQIAHISDTIEFLVLKFKKISKLFIFYKSLYTLDGQNDFFASDFNPVSTEFFCKSYFRGWWDICKSKPF